MKSESSQQKLGRWSVEIAGERYPFRRRVLPRQDRDVWEVLAGETKDQLLPPAVPAAAVPASCRYVQRRATR
jgi:hypothetical protein